MTLSRNFKRSEFACRCGCGFDTVDIETLKILTRVREHYNKPLFITSGCRCPKHNAKEGGAPKSYHVQGRAVDFRVAGVKAKEVYDFLDEEYPYQYGLGLYSTWVHLDTRSGKQARW